MFVYGYARVSHLDAAEKGLGIQAQIDGIQRWWNWAREHKAWDCHQWGKVGWEGVREDGKENDTGFFVDKAVSAYRKRFIHRPAGGRLDARLQAGDAVVIYRLDRSFRNVADFSTTTDRWIKAGIRLVFINPHLDLSSAMGTMMAHVMAAFAQFESAVKSERIREANAVWRVTGVKRKNGVAKGWKDLRDGHRAVPDDIAREDIILAYHWSKLGYSRYQVANLLEYKRAEQENRPKWPRIPLKGSENRPWTPDMVHSLLLRPREPLLPEAAETRVGKGESTPEQERQLVASQWSHLLKIEKKPRSRPCPQKQREWQARRSGNYNR